MSRDGASDRLRAAVYAFAVVSAAAALVYQVVWTRLLALTFGRTTLAASAVVAGFMGGMALGAGLYHRVARSRPRGALRVYAALELGIALGAIGLTAVFEGLPGAFAAAAASVPSGLPLTLLRIGTVIALLLVPAAFMGATYPALCSVLIHSRAGVGRHLGRIYGLNTLGAALGAALAGFAGIERLGLRASVAAAVAVNLAIAAIAAGLAARAGEAEAGLDALPDAEAVLETRLPQRVTGAVLLLSGFATLAYEILWFRALQYLFGNSTYALTLMLVIFLLGLGFGGLLFGPVTRRARPERDLALCQLGIAGLALGAIGAEAWLLADDGLVARLSVFAPAMVERSWAVRLGTDAALGLALMLPATLGMGLSFPLATRLYLGDVRQLGRRVGASVVLANLGSIAGVVLAALWILPAFGTVGGTIAVAALNLGLFAVVWWTRSDAAPRRVGTIALAAAGFAVVAWALPPRLSFQGEGRTAFAGSTLVFEEEGDLATVQVWQRKEPPLARAMTIDGVAIGVSRGWVYSVYSKQRLLAHLGLALDATTRSALMIGLGSASTLDALAGYPQITRLDVVEISAGVVRASALFEEAAVLGDPRVHLAVEDAAHFLLRGGAPYDLIVSDGKQNPDFSTNWTLMSRDFYARALARLGQRGLFVQWIPLSTLAEDFRITLRTFAEVFPQMEVFAHAPHWVMLVGSPAPIAGRARLSAERFRVLPAKRDLRSFRIPTRAALFAHWVAGREALREVVGPGPLSSWNRSPVEFSAYRTTPAQRGEAPRRNLALLLEAAALERERGRSPFLPADSRWMRSARLRREAHLRALEGDPAAARALLDRALALNPSDRLAEYLRDGLGGPGPRREKGAGDAPTP